MPTTKYVAHYEGKLVGKRTSTSDRIYTHAVVVKADEVKARKYAYEYCATASDRRDYEYNVKKADQGIQHEHICVTPWRAEPDYVRLQDAIEAIEGGYEAYVARRRLQEIDRFEHGRAKGAFEPKVACWNSRLDLARKECAKYARWTRYEWAKIVPAEIVTQK
jgi:hypothetical protein